MKNEDNEAVEGVATRPADPGLANKKIVSSAVMEEGAGIEESATDIVVSVDTWGAFTESCENVSIPKFAVVHLSKPSTQQMLAALRDAALAFARQYQGDNSHFLNPPNVYAAIYPELVTFYGSLDETTITTIANVINEGEGLVAADLDDGELYGLVESWVGRDYYRVLPAALNLPPNEAAWHADDETDDFALADPRVRRVLASQYGFSVCYIHPSEPVTAETAEIPWSVLEVRTM